MPLTKQRLRRQSVLRGIGDTNPGFVTPSQEQLDASPPSEALANAAVALLSYFAAHGVPSEHGPAGGNVAAFQSAWNANPLSHLNGTDYSTLSVDDAYGPNTHDALAAVAGTAPAVNTGPATP